MLCAIGNRLVGALKVVSHARGTALGLPLRGIRRASCLTGGERPRVLVLGGGFAGIGAARKLKGADVDVVLVDRHDYHTFQPLLYQLATGLLETTAVGHSLRDLVKDQDNATIHKAPVTAIDLDARKVRFDGLAPITYDYLVFALGAQVNFFGTEGAAEHAFPMYTLRDAVKLKDHVLERWEAADKDSALVDDGALTVVVVGGGPTGVETAGALAELYRSNFVTDYRGLPQEKARVDPRRGRRRDLRDVQAEPARICEGRARAADGRGHDGRSRAVGLADARDALDG